MNKNKTTSDELKNKKNHYNEFLVSVKFEISAAKKRLARSVNQQLIEHYLRLGNYICKSQQFKGWGKAEVEKLSRDLIAEYRDNKGYSASNLWRMKQFYEAIQGDVVLSHLAIVLPWLHNVVLVTKIKDKKERQFYAQKAVENNWSRNTLELQIDRGLYKKSK